MQMTQKQLAESENAVNFDKFMDAILIQEARFKRDKLEAASGEEPQRKRAWLRQERPLSRTYVRTPGNQ